MQLSSAAPTCLFHQAKIISRNHHHNSSSTLVCGKERSRLPFAKLAELRMLTTRKLPNPSFTNLLLLLLFVCLCMCSWHSRLEGHARDGVQLLLIPAMISYPCLVPCSSNVFPFPPHPPLSNDAGSPAPNPLQKVIKQIVEKVAKTGCNCPQRHENICRHSPPQCHVEVVGSACGCSKPGSGNRVCVKQNAPRRRRNLRDQPFPSRELSCRSGVQLLA